MEEPSAFRINRRYEKREWAKRNTHQGSWIERQQTEPTAHRLHPIGIYSNSPDSLLQQPRLVLLPNALRLGCRRFVIAATVDKSLEMAQLSTSERERSGEEGRLLKGNFLLIERTKKVTTS